MRLEGLDAALLVVADAALVMAAVGGDQVIGGCAGNVRAELVALRGAGASPDRLRREGARRLGGDGARGVPLQARLSVTPAGGLRRRVDPLGHARSGVGSQAIRIWFLCYSS